MDLLERSPDGLMDDRSAARTSIDPALAVGSSLLGRSLARTRARSRLEMELRSVAVDLLGGCQPGDLPDDCAEWLASTVEAAVRGACDASLAVLTETLQARLDAAPLGVARRLEEAEVRHDAGFI